MKKTAWALASAALLSLGLTGCAGLNQEGTAEEATVEQVIQTKEATTVPQLCLVPKNQVQELTLLNLLGEGLKQSGFDVKAVTTQAEFDACAHCFTFQLRVNEKTKLVEGIDLISFHGKQLDLTASGPAMADGKFTHEMLVQYGREFGQLMMKALKGEAVGAPNQVEATK